MLQTVLGKTKDVQKEYKTDGRNNKLFVSPQNNEKK